MAGLALVVFALVVYPAWSVYAGHGYPAMPTFGLPCPTTLFTIGLLAFLVAPYPRSPLVVPVLWCLVGAQAAFLLGVWQDLALLVAAVLGAVLITRPGENVHSDPREPAHKVYPYLLRELPIERPNQVWASDITYIPMRSGVMYLMAILDWYSRYVVAWSLSNTLETRFCLDAMEAALSGARPEIFNNDQGVQYTSADFTGLLTAHDVAISMDGRGRVFDNTSGSGARSSTN